MAHAHGHDHLHDHDVLLPLEDNPIWQQDNVTLHSVGMDVGSSGSQVVFSRLHLRRMGEELTSRYLVVRRETLYQSPVALTPYRDDDLIDAAELGSIVDRAYAAAGVDPGGVDTGVVILTGEALRRRNARRITEVLAERAGELVCASAGHNLEARLAAFGSGAAQASWDHDARVLNVDIGGGTTKLAIAERGSVLATAAIHVGGRLVVVDEDDRIVRLEPAGADHARRVGFDWHVGDTATPDELARVAASMADVLVAAVTCDPLPPEVVDHMLTDPIEDLGAVDELLFSGGVAEYVYGREDRDLRDLGPHLGRALRERTDRLPGRQLPPGECIRATVLGASQYSVQLSGNTSWIEDADRLLPRRNLQVLRPTYPLGDDVEAASVADGIRRHLTAFDVEHHDEDVALALHFRGLPTYARLAAFAAGVVDGLADRVAAGTPLYLALDGDVAMTLGRLLRDELGVTGDLLVLDGLDLWDFDYVDLGRVRDPSRTVPVTIKSLVFDQELRRAASPA